MEPRVLRVERVFPISFLQGRGYTWFESVFDSLVEEIKLRLCGCFVDKQATFVMNSELYRLFYSVAPINRGPYWDGIYIKEDLTSEHISSWDKDGTTGRILLEYREPVYIPSVINGFKIKELHFAIPKDLEIEKVIFNDPATIVMWNDGTKTVVKCQEGDTFDPEKGLAMCIVKKSLGLKKFYKAFNDGVKNLDVEENIWDWIRKITS